MSAKYQKSFDFHRARTRGCSKIETGHA
ncbi:hypothetical protein CaCOL14_009811 [Colletotrichum acutatum]